MTRNGLLSATLWYARRYPTLIIGGGLLLAITVVSFAAPYLTAHDPVRLNVVQRMRPPSADHIFGTDAYGRDLFARVLYGGRVSVIVGVSVALLATVLGCLIGIVSGYFRRVDAVVMRIMDGMMAIPGILLAIGMMALLHASVALVIIAITVPEIPRVVRLVRSLVLTIREQAYVEAAISVGTRFPRLLAWHIFPNVTTPLIVQATYICASAILTEASLSFLGVGTPPEIPSWGNIISEGRLYVQIAFGSILFPGLFLGVMVLAINILGDGLRDLLDPRLARRM
jgi:peptide/nickel transport system permease protein